MDHDMINTACAQWLGVPFAWGKDDCCTSVCDVLQALTGSDPMAHLRGLYDSEESALALAETYGGFVEMVQFMARSRGFKTVAWPFEGAAFGIIAGLNGPMMALWVGDKWVARGLDGPVVSPRRAGVLAWGLPHA